MNELKEQIEDTLTRVKEGRDIDFETEICHGRTIDEGVDAIMKLIETYTSKKELEARIAELRAVKYCLDNFNGFGLNNGDGVAVIEDIDGNILGEPKNYVRLKINQLQSQLTNNKEE